MTVTGKTMAENLADVEDVPALNSKQDVIMSVKNPIKPYSNLKVLRGNIAPEGAVAKISGKEGEVFKGTACVFDDERDMIEAFNKGLVSKGSVVVIRYEGPKNGMPEMLTATAAIMGSGQSKDIALITDGRFSGASHGFIIGHISPEAYSGGPIALL